MPEFKWEAVETEKLRIWEIAANNTFTVYDKIFITHFITHLRGFMYFYLKIVSINSTNRWLINTL